ncbi:hypothetical protein [Bifidobacterium callitrichos]|uniref:Uncharacterized protein n=1 Tax=Bifidobacterium callitrichos DSM 23973 TaxID=1437609 RepID=A0A087A9L1_9BIFI|nr:hypothetical protein [Bifidobacterium callitrichos]KFI55461.1 hypothetical protein BCAL_0719 [Bifidobacterium callitrichos DSM 23973]
MADEDEPNDRYLDMGIDALGGRAGDETAAGSLPDDESDRYEQDAPDRSEIKDDAEDMRPDSSLPTVKGDAKMFAFVTG